MPKTKDPPLTYDAPPEGSYATGPAGGTEHTGDTCDRCGRGELVKTSVTVAEGQQLLDTAGDEVADGAKVTVCALCGAVQTRKSFKEGGRTGPAAKSKTPAKAKRKTRSAKRSPTRRSSTSRKKTAAKRGR